MDGDGQEHEEEEVEVREGMDVVVLDTDDLLVADQMWSLTASRGASMSP
eukprot:gene22928-30103_t